MDPCVSVDCDLLADVERWRAEQCARSQFVVRPAAFANSREWLLSDGALVHKSGGFFSVVGGQSGGDPNSDRPFIHQPEVGILGFLSRRTESGVELLVQAKTEPGNPGGVQLAPTFQCTASNYFCRHGGTRAPYAERFLAPRDRIHIDVPQSEQGTRFIGKYNRNVVLELEQPAPIEGEAWRWLSVSALGRLATASLVLNTDARSVLTSCPWRQLVVGEPFAAAAEDDPFVRALHDSYRASSAAVSRVLSWLGTRRASVRTPFVTLPISEMAGYRMSGDAVRRADGRGVGVRFFEVVARDREVSHWTQPLLHSRGRGEVALVMQQRAGVLRFLFRAAAEPGFANHVQLTPAGLRTPGALSSEAGQGVLAWLERPAARHRTLIECELSEEGGRFYRDCNRYRLVLAEADEEVPVEDEQLWLTLAEIEELKVLSGVFTNESRSALSLLLRFLGGPP